LAVLSILVDYDNVDRQHLRAGPVSLAKLLTSLVSPSILALHTSVDVRMYGGWMCGANLTKAAQRLVPDLHANSPTIIYYLNEGRTLGINVNVSLAYKQIGAYINLEETLVKDRQIRKFRSSLQLDSCASSNSCGMRLFSNTSFSTRCSTAGCGMTLENAYVRDEQKMVDTMLVADIAHLALAAKNSHIVVVSSDTDMWPGILLGLQNGCSIVHLHTKHGWRTQRHLTRTLPPLSSRSYIQLSV